MSEIIRYQKINSRWLSLLICLWVPVFITTYSTRILADPTINQIQLKSYTTLEYEAQAENILNLLEQEKYTQIEQILNNSIKEKKLTRGGFYYAVSVLDTAMSSLDPSWVTFLDNWIKKSPNSTIAYSVRAYFHYYQAWDIRGNRYVNKTPAENIQEYLKRLALATADTEKAIALNSNNPIAIFAKLRIKRNMGRSSARDFEPVFKKAITLVPNFMQAYQEKSLYLTPQWGGSEQQVLAFVRQAAKSAPRGTAIPLLVPQAHEDLCRNYPNKQYYYNQPQVWNEVEKNYLRLIKDFPRAGWYPLWFAEVAKIAKKDQLARQYFKMAISREPNNPEIKRRASKYQ
ncbi:hypothetical protein C7H19_17975 [Aphanothece hegewaldii CCALA 016]|uniref:DUF4034 domain-containing protein n=1 Tax=Aphanothece hegewaldii CCALA 016 TaxID=2107694 RepID=A0A2T1LUA0_9CHRO|nr:DUF4034 domain-containing protein [Aphanothece hegewaldii]PSF35031.1 hypothetical protein C7H19_17975 [Aphanothece hegewaldii CCALA 016]